MLVFLKFSLKRETPGVPLFCGENEREKCTLHRGEIVQLREELHQAKTECSFNLSHD